MVRELKNLQTGTSIKELTPKENLTATANTIGQTAATLREISRKVSEKVMECGKKDQELVTNTRGSTKLIKSMAMEFFHGHQETFTKGTMRKIFVQDTGKCIGVMVAITKEIG